MPFPKDMSPKVNVITQLEFELAYCDVTVQLDSHHAMRTPPISSYEIMNIDHLIGIK